MPPGATLYDMGHPGEQRLSQPSDRFLLVVSMGAIIRRSHARIQACDGPSSFPVRVAL